MMNETSGDQARTASPLGVGRRLWRRTCGITLFGLACLILGSSVVFVDETECVIVSRLGKIVAVYDRPEERGGRVKLPWPIDTVRRFDRRVQLFDPPGREIFTRDKKNVTVDTYVCWKIAEPDPTAEVPTAERPVVRFFQSLTDVDVAESRLDNRLRSILSTTIGQVELSGLVHTDHSESGPQSAEAGLLSRVSEEIKQHVVQRPDEESSLAERWGIEIVDVRFKRINLPLGNQQAVFERMKSERRKIADRYRSAGMAENNVIKSQADRQYNEILARARADAERIRGGAEAEAISVLNRAHAQDPELYRVMRTLDAYRKILNEKTTLVLSASSNLLKMMTEGIPESKIAPPSQTSPAGTTASPEGDEVSSRPSPEPQATESSANGRPETLAGPPVERGADVAGGATP